MDVDARARALYGEALPPARGVLHVTAVGRAEDGLFVLAVGPAPRSETDWFALCLTRARVDAILITGSILRAEPTLAYDLPEPLARWRAKPPPRLAILTRGEDLPLAHPVYTSDAARPVVLTSAAEVERLRALLPARVELVALPAPSPRAALAWLLAQPEIEGVSVEAGPQVSLPLYDDPLAIDELLLSVYEGPLTEGQRVAPFLSEASLAERLVRVGGPTAVEEPSGRWVFSRWGRP